MMIKKRLCSHCKTGQLAYQQDNRAPMCPYIQHHSGRDCRYYVPIHPSKLSRWLHKLKQNHQHRI